MATFHDVLHMASRLGYAPSRVDSKEELFHITDEDDGINMVVDCEEEILVLEQAFMPVTEKTNYRMLLELNRNLVHGAFAITDDNYVIWRDTLRLESLDPEELAGSINALSLAMAEHAHKLLAMSR